jgi:hypothetical protein
MIRGVNSGRGTQILRTGSVTERLLVALTVLGFVVPNVFVGLYIADEGTDFPHYLSLWTASIPSTQLLLDLVIATTAFFIWAAVEGPRAEVKRWWLCVPASLLVGVCFGLPLFLLMRERALNANRPPAPSAGPA